MNTEPCEYPLAKVINSKAPITKNLRGVIVTEYDGSLREVERFWVRVSGYAFRVGDLSSLWLKFFRFHGQNGVNSERTAGLGICRPRSLTQRPLRPQALAQS